MIVLYVILQPFVLVYFPLADEINVYIIMEQCIHFFFLSLFVFTLPKLEKPTCSAIIEGSMLFISK